jgi:hypothetical protein
MPSDAPSAGAASLHATPPGPSGAPATAPLRALVGGDPLTAGRYEVQIAGSDCAGLRTDDLALAMAIAGAVRVRAGVCLMSESITRRRHGEPDG